MIVFFLGLLVGLGEESEYSECSEYSDYSDYSDYSEYSEYSDYSEDCKTFICLRSSNSASPFSVFRSQSISITMRTFSSWGRVASIQWMGMPRRSSMPRNQVIWRLANWWMAISSWRNISS